MLAGILPAVWKEDGTFDCIFNSVNLGARRNSNWIHRFSFSVLHSMGRRI